MCDFYPVNVNSFVYYTQHLWPDTNNIRKFVLFLYSIVAALSSSLKTLQNPRATDIHHCVFETRYNEPIKQLVNNVTNLRDGARLLVKSLDVRREGRNFCGKETNSDYISNETNSRTNDLLRVSRSSCGGWHP